MTYIELKNLSKIYGESGNEFCALKDINLKIDRNEMIAIMGASGSGKSTLLNILGCIDNFEKGEYILDGADVKSLNNGKKALLRNTKIGFIFQNFALFNSYSVMENIVSPIIYRNIIADRKLRMRESAMKEKANLILDRLGLKEFANKQVSKLSGGQQQRVAIGRVLMQDSDIILADEPTGALDSGTSKDIMKILTELNKDNKTLIIVTHDENVAAYCGRKIKIKDGQIIEGE